MDANAKVIIQLAGGGDERAPAKSLSYIRRALDAEAREAPQAASTAVFGSLKLISRSSASDLADQFMEHIKIVVLSAPDNSLLYVNGEAVIDVDDAPSTLPGSRSWLVFGIGSIAPRLAVRQSREQLSELWSATNLDPTASGI